MRRVRPRLGGPSSAGGTPGRAPRCRLSRSRRSGVSAPRAKRRRLLSVTSGTPSAASGAYAAAVFGKGEQERGRGREVVGNGQRGEARRVAEEANTLATEAQKQALVRRSDAQQRAEVVYTDLDKQINDLEKLYSATAPG